MDYRYHIAKAIDYIEENLKNDIDNAALARCAGYSEYHFLRVFREVVGLTPADYIRKRRISEIVRLVNEEERPISDIAFEYGFNSKENFVRAFKREHHILPTDHRASKNSLRLYERITFDLQPITPDVQITELEPFRLIAYKSDEPSPPLFWNRYNAHGLSKKLSGGRIVEDLGACRWNTRENLLDYYIGIRESDAAGDLTGTEVLDIAGGRYAVFTTPPATHYSFVSTIHRTWEQIRIWLSENGFRRTGGWELEAYVEQSRTYSEKIYIPIMEDRKNEKA